MTKLFDRLTVGMAERVPLEEARLIWARVRVDVGLSATTPKLLSPPEANQKLAKSGGIWGLNLLPHRMAGVGNVCPWSTVECRKHCLNSAGRGYANFVQEARKCRTILLVEHTAAFATLLEYELVRLPSPAAVRLNVTSDVTWETVAPWIFTLRPDVQFYDYTACWSERPRPSNYHLTLSAKEHHGEPEISDALADGKNVTVVFRVKKGQPLPEEWHGMPVIDGDHNDQRWLDPSGVIVGLRGKGKAINSTSPFVRVAA